MKHRTKISGIARRIRQGRQNKNWPMYQSKELAFCLFSYFFVVGMSCIFFPCIAGAVD